jgi:glycosyltransferase involved in cell wall biosynthesis
VKIAALLGVMDEIELVGVSIAHLRTIGVDLIITADAGSTDGTRQFLETLDGDEDIEVIDVGPSPEERRRRQLEVARRANADWIMCLDADEFWLPATGSLKDCPSLSAADVIAVDRFNIPPARRGPFERGELASSNYRNVFLCVHKIPAFMTVMEQHPNVPWLVGADILPKVLAKTAAIRAIGAGGHSVESADRRLRHTTPPDLLIAHVPISTYARFERKVANIAALMRTHPDYFTNNRALHWQRWAALHREGRLQEEFDRQMLDEERLAGLIESGAIATAASLFAQRRG